MIEINFFFCIWAPFIYQMQISSKWKYFAVNLLGKDGILCLISKYSFYILIYICVSLSQILFLLYFLSVANQFTFEFMQLTWFLKYEWLLFNILTFLFHLINRVVFFSENISTNYLMCSFKWVSNIARLLVFSVFCR